MTVDLGGKRNAQNIFSRIFEIIIKQSCSVRDDFDGFPRTYFQSKLKVNVESNDWSVFEVEGFSFAYPLSSLEATSNIKFTVSYQKSQAEPVQTESSIARFAREYCTT